MNKYSNPWSEMDGILLGYPFDQLLDQECGLLRNRRPGIKLANLRPNQAITAGDILDAPALAQRFLDFASADLDLLPNRLKKISLVKNEKLRLHNLMEQVKLSEISAISELKKELVGLINDELRVRGGNTKKQHDFIQLIGDFVSCSYKTHEDQMSSGNIVITGAPGTAKSTLALQFAVACVRCKNQSVPAYISLETPLEAVRSKARLFNWAKHLREVQHIHEIDDHSSTEHLAELLLKVLSRPNKCPAKTGICETNIVGICRQCGKSAFDPCVLMPSLSPRPIEATWSHDALFATRFRQLERLLEAGQHLNERIRGDDPGKYNIRHFLPLVVIDSLNMLGLHTLNREEIYRLFTLFRRCKTTGVFVVETTQDTPFDSTMADVVISLTMEEDQDYTLRYLEIAKSRYYHQVYGRHVFRTSPVLENRQVPTVPDYDNPRVIKKYPKHGVVVYPSLHYLVLKTDRESPLARPDEAEGGKLTESRNVSLSSDDIKDPDEFVKQLLDWEPNQYLSEKNKHKALGLCQKWRDRLHSDGPDAREIVSKLDDLDVNLFPGAKREGLSRTPQDLRAELDVMFPGAFFGRSVDFGISAFERVLPPNLNRGQVVMLEGPRGTFKTTFALNFIAKGFQEDESVLFIRLNDIGLLQEDAQHSLRHCPRLSHDMYKKGMDPWNKLRNVTRTTFSKGIIAKDNADPLWRNLTATSKIDINVWASTAHKGLSFKPRLFEIAFKGGFLLPEEFVQIIREILVRRRGNERIRRVVLDDVSQIGVSYPFLRHSRTTGDFFLAAFVHLMRNHHVDLVMTGTTGQLSEANDAVSRGIALADTVGSCKSMDIFGGRYIVISGEGLIAGKRSEPQKNGESVPAVVQLDVAKKQELFHVNEQFLQGLVGFEQGSVHRPGILVHLFEENHLIHGAYNAETERMLLTSLAGPSPQHIQRRKSKLESKNAADKAKDAQFITDVSVIPFSSEMSEAVHDSFQVLGSGSPINKTVICTVDEFSSAGKSQIEEPFCRFSLDSIPWKEDDFRIHPAGNAKDKQEQWPPGAWPYYGNVLLIAYRKKWPTRSGPKTVLRSRRRELFGSMKKEHKLKSWQSILKALTDFVPKNGKLSPIAHPFWYDRSASETLSCMLLDALAVGHAKKKHTKTDDIRINDVVCLKNSGRTELYQQQKWELKAMASLLRMAEKSHAILKQETQNIKGELDAGPNCQLPPNAAVYVCWYSQLRELIQRNPKLAKELMVCALPGRGFKGDWSVGVVKGSVSVALGKEVILQLCSKKEELKRYTQGVGLPVRRAFYEKDMKFFAWPNGIHVKLATVGDIHKNAYSRVDIDDYPAIRSRLWNMASQLTREWNPVIVDRIFRQCQMLRDRGW